MLNLIVIFSFVSLIKNLDLNTDKKTSLKDYYFKLQTSEINRFKNKNLIIVYVESLDQNFNNFNKQNLLPEFSKFKKEFISLKKFTQLNQIDWTMGGIFSSQCGLPLKDYSLLKENFICISDILKKNNYENFFLLGHESEFQYLNNF